MSSFKDTTAPRLSGMEQLETRAMFAGLVDADSWIVLSEVEHVRTAEVAPRLVDDTSGETGGFSSGFDEIAFNPQPEPPKVNVDVESNSFDCRLSQVSFNPQPEPPSAFVFAGYSR